MKDKDNNELQLGDIMLDTTGYECGVIQIYKGNIVLMQGQDDYGRDKFDSLENVIKTGYTKKV
jgi:hypothetical protein